MDSADQWLFRLSLATGAAVLVSIAAAQILLAATLVAWILLRPRRVHWPGWVLPALVLLLATLASLAMSPEPEIGLGPVRKFVLFSMGLLAASFIRGVGRLRVTVIVLLLVAAVGSSAAIVEFVVQYLEFRSTGLLEDDPTVLARTTGFMGHWMTFSGEQMLVWCALIPLAWVWRSRVYWVLMSLVAAGILLGFTRGAWLGTGAGVLTMAFYLPPRLLVRMLIPVVLVGAIASGLIVNRISMSFTEEDFAPDSSRLAMLDVGLRMVGDHPLFGVGPERVGVEFTDYYEGDAIETFYSGHLHNNFLQIAAERGLLALAAFVWMLLRIGLDLGRFSRSALPHVRWPAVGGLAVLAAFVVAGLFEFNFGDSEMLMFFLFLISIPYGMAGGEAGETPPPRSPAAAAAA